MNVDPHVGKMTLYGAIFGCLDPVLTIAGERMQRIPLGRSRSTGNAVRTLIRRNPAIAHFKRLVGVDA